MDIIRTDVQSFFEYFYDNIFNAYKSGNKENIIYDVRFFCDLANNLQSLNSSDSLTNYTQMMQMDNNWNEKYYQSNKTFQTSGIVNFFNKDNTYIIFKIIKKLLTSCYHYSREEYDLIKYKTNNQMIVMIMSSYMINKILIKIYKIFNKNYEKMINTNHEEQKISNKFDEIYMKYQIPINVCSKPNFYQNMRHGSKMFDDKNINSILLLGPFPIDNYDSVYEIYDYLQKYFDIINEIHILDRKEINLFPHKPNTELKDISMSPRKASQVTSPEINEFPNLIKKYKKKSIPLTLKRIVWNKWIGEEVGKAKCSCCKLTEITQLSFNCGHILAESKGGELKMDNLKPICQSCNSSMGSMNMDEYMKKYGF